MQISVVHLVPPLAIFLTKSPVVQRHDLSSVVHCMSAAAPLSIEIERMVSRILGETPITQGTVIPAYFKCGFFETRTTQKET